MLMMSDLSLRLESLYIMRNESQETQKSSRSYNTVMVYIPYGKYCGIRKKESIHFRRYGMSRQKPQTPLPPGSSPSGNAEVLLLASVSSL